MKKIVLILLVVWWHNGLSQSNLKIVVPIGHTSPVTSLAVTPDDRFLLSGGADNLVQLWSTETGRLLKTYRGHTGTVVKVYVSSSGTYFLSVDGEGKGLIRELASGNVLDSCVVSSGEEIITSKKEDSFFWIGKENKLTSWKPGQRLKEIQPTKSFYKIAVSAKGNFLSALTLPRDHEYIYLDFLPTYQALLIKTKDLSVKNLSSVKRATGRQLAFSSDESLAFVGDPGNTVNAYATATGLLSSRAKSIIWIDDLEVSENLVRLYSYEGWKAWNPANNTITQTDAPSAVFTPDASSSKKPVVAYFNISKLVAQATGKEISIVDLESKKEVRKLRGLSLEAPDQISFAPDNSAMAYKNQSLRLWSFKQGKMLSLPFDSINYVKLDGVDKGMLILGFADRIELRNPENGKELQTIPFDFEFNPGKINSVQFSSDYKLMLLDGEGGSYLKKMNWNNLLFYGFRPAYEQFAVSYGVWIDENPPNSPTKTYSKYTSEVANFTGPFRHSFDKSSSGLLTQISYQSKEKEYGMQEIASYYVAKWKSPERLVQSSDAPLVPPSKFKFSERRIFNGVNFKDIPTGSFSVSADAGYSVTTAAGKLVLTDFIKGAIASEDGDGLLWYESTTINGYGTDQVSITPGALSFHTVEPWFAVSDDRTHAIRTILAEDRKELKPFVGHTDRVLSLAFSRDGKWMASASMDNTVRLWDVASRKELASIVTLNENDWVVVHPSGLFDATSAAMNELYFSTGNQTIGLEQMKERFYEPNLLRKILAGETLRTVAGLDKIELYPRIQLAMDTVNAMLTVKLSDQGGGIGKTSLFINGKEAVEDIRSLITTQKANTPGQQMIQVDLSTNRHVIWGDLNFIGVKAYNSAGFLTSPVEKMFYAAPEKQKVMAAYEPHLYAMIVGVSDYANDELDLKYSSKDAQDVASALATGGKKLFGDRVHITLLSSDAKENEKQPTKANIKRTLDDISTSSGLADLVIIYFSGHGTNLGGEDGDFLYLTADARGFSFSDPAVRQSSSLSGSELTEYLKSMVAKRQVVIFDACASGRVVENMLAKRDVPSSTLRALERMKDRTGTYILTGCAADAVSYEASKFGQGLLTYSLLSGMRGAALREDKYIDVLKLFQYAKDEVPRLAENVGGIQEPKVFSPYGGESFDIGILDTKDKGLIPLTSAKPFFIRSAFQNEAKLRDDLGLGKKMDEELGEQAQKGKDSPLIFLDAAEFPDAYFISGRYRAEGNNLHVKMILFQNDREVKSLEKIFPADNLDGMRKDIMSLTLSALK